MPGYKNLSRYCLALIIALSGYMVKAQQMQSVTNSKYSGIYGSILNPSLPVLSPLYFDLNLASSNLYVQNNYIFIFPKEKKLSRLFNNEGIDLNEKFYKDYYTPGDKFGHVNLRVTGPSAMVAAGRHAFGITTAVRSVISINNIPYTLAKFFYEGLYFPEQYDTDFDYPEEINFGSLHWGETGLNYSAIVLNRYDNTLSAGISLKYLIGYAGTYVDIGHLSYRVPNYDTLIIHDADAEMGLSAPIDFNTNAYLTDLNRGKGTGLDVGITWERKAPNGDDNRHFGKLCGQSYTPYLFRVGISLTDLGKIRFTENAMKLRVNDGQLFWPGISGTQYSSINGMTAELSQRMLGDPDRLRVDDEFTMHLPAMLNLHGDLNITAITRGRNSSSLSYNLNRQKPLLGHGEWFASGLLMLPVTSDRMGVVKPSLVSAGLRYEARLFQASFNMSLSGWDRFMVGAGLRLGYFFIGTDDLVSFMKLRDYTGTNLYAGIRFNLAKGRCRDSGMKCPDIF